MQEDGTNNFTQIFPFFPHFAKCQHSACFCPFKSGDTAQIYASVIRPKCCMLNGKFQLLGKRPEPYRGCSDISQSAAIKHLMLCSSVGSNWICGVNFSHLCLSLHHQIRVVFCCWTGSFHLNNIQNFYISVTPKKKKGGGAYKQKDSLRDYIFSKLLTANGTFSNSFEFSSHIHLGEKAQTGKGRPFQKSK